MAERPEDMFINDPELLAKMVASNPYVQYLSGDIRKAYEAEDRAKDKAFVQKMQQKHVRSFSELPSHLDKVITKSSIKPPIKISKAFSPDLKKALLSKGISLAKIKDIEKSMKTNMPQESLIILNRFIDTAIQKGWKPIQKASPLEEAASDPRHGGMTPEERADYEKNPHNTRPASPPPEDESYIPNYKDIADKARAKGYEQRIRDLENEPEGVAPVSPTNRSGYDKLKAKASTLSPNQWAAIIWGLLGLATGGLVGGLMLGYFGYYFNQHLRNKTGMTVQKAKDIAQTVGNAYKKATDARGGDAPIVTKTAVENMAKKVADSMNSDRPASVQDLYKTIHAVMGDYFMNDKVLKETGMDKSGTIIKNRVDKSYWESVKKGTGTVNPKKFYKDAPDFDEEIAKVNEAMKQGKMDAFLRAYGIDPKGFKAPDISPDLGPPPHKGTMRAELARKKQEEIEARKAQEAELKNKAAMGNVTAESPGFVEDVDVDPSTINAAKAQKKKGIIPTSQEPQAKADFSHTNNPKTHKPFTFDDYNTDANLVGMVLEHGGNKPEDKEQILEDIWQDVVKNGEGQQDLDFNTFKTTLKEASVGKWNAAFKDAETLSVKQTAPEPPAQAEKAQEKEEKGPTVNKPVGRVPVNKTPAEKKTVEPIVEPEDPNIAKLKDLGYTQELINKIKPWYIQHIINNKIPPPGGEKKVAQKKEEDKPITEVQKEPTVEPAKTKDGRTVTANKPFETPKAKTQREVTEQAQRGRDEFDIPAYKADDIDFMKKGRDTDMDRALYKAMDSVNKAINTIRKEGPWVQEIPEGRVAGEEDEEMKWLPAALQGGGLKSLIGHPKAGSTISEAANKVGARFLQGLQEEGKGESLINYSPKQLGLAILEALDGMINEGDDGKSGKSWSDNLAKLISSQGKIPNQQMRKAVAEPIADQEKRIKKVAEHYNSETEGGDIDNANDGSHMDVGSVAKKSKKLVTY